MKWLRLGLLIVMFLLLVAPLPLTADSTATITITAVGYVVGSPTGLTLTYISDYEVGISWTMGEAANNTMVRAAYGRVPEDIADGYLVYYGNGTSCNDTAVNFEETASQIYYRAWSQTATGDWETEGISDWIEGVGMTFIGIIMLCALLIIAGFWRKSQPMLWVAALTWIGFAFWQRSITPAWGTWDLHEILFYIGFLMAIVCIVEAVMIYREESPVEEKPLRKEPSEEYWDNYNKMMGRVRASSTRIKRRR
ncbi:MAG TPA: hypothetical protein VMW50_09970 [Dehalococcoidia bacterium]|nr:hypothetical protein [Dehalococcoidia bacterium]